HNTDTTLNKIQSNRCQSIEQIAKDLIDLNDSKFTETIEQIKRIYNVNEEIMVYSRGNQKGEIFSSYLQLKAVEFLNTGFYKKNTSIQAIMTKIIELEKDISSLKKDKTNLTAHIRSLSMQLVRARDTKRRYIS
ncbi:22265_t:CDS:2, partial [Gigaspora rosea]